MTLPKTANVVMNKSYESRFPCVALDLGGHAFIFSPFTVILAVCLWNTALDQ